MHFRKLALSLIIPVLLAGCATPTTMAYSDKSKTPVNPTGAVFLMTATLKNNYHSSFQPRLLVVNVEKVGATDKADRFNFTMDRKARLQEADSPQDGNSYLLRMQLPPGEYALVGLTCMAQHVVLMTYFFAPLHEHMVSAQPGVFYLGHVDATVRERNGDEFKAGPSIPLIDQAVGGASGGTFDILVADQWATDEAVFRRGFPPLTNATIQTSILSAV